MNDGTAHFNFDYFSQGGDGDHLKEMVFYYGVLSYLGCNDNKSLSAGLKEKETDPLIHSTDD